MLHFCSSNDLAQCVMNRFLLAFVLLVPLSANVVLINTSIGSYDVDYVLAFGISIGDPSNAENQPWLGNGELAIEFASLLGNALGPVNTLPNYGTGCSDTYSPLAPLCGDYGPFFAVAPIFTHQVVTYARYEDGQVYGFLEYGLDLANWATVSEVTPTPEPGTLSLFVTALLGFGLLRLHRRVA